MKDFDLRKYLAEGRLLKEEIDINKISKLGDYNETEDSYKYKDHLVQKYIDGGKTIYTVFKDRGEKTDSYGSPDFESSDLKKVEDFLTENKLLKEFVGKELEDRNEPLYDKLVPGQGDAETVEGEMLRAINRLIYRYYNDGDKYYEGYGTETAGPAHSFLVNANHPQKAIMNRLFKEFISDDEYERMLKDILDVILDHIESRQGEYTKNTLGGIFKYEPEFEDMEEDDDDYTYDYDDDEYEEDDDYYQEGVTEGKEDEALKNKAKKANAPLGALRAIYNKGLAAFKSGHRPGANQHQWAMARVNSVLTGGPARKTDDAQWKQIQKFRKNKKKK